LAFYFHILVSISVDFPPMRVENFGSHKSKNKQHSSKSHNTKNRHILTISERDMNVKPFTQFRHVSR